MDGFGSNKFKAIGQENVSANALIVKQNTRSVELLLIS